MFFVFKWNAITLLQFASLKINHLNLVSGSVILLSGQQREQTITIPDHSRFRFHFEDSNNHLYSSINRKGKKILGKGQLIFKALAEPARD